MDGMRSWKPSTSLTTEFVMPNWLKSMYPSNISWHLLLAEIFKIPQFLSERAMVNMLLHVCCEARIGLCHKKRGPYFWKGSIPPITFYREALSLEMPVVAYIEIGRCWCGRKGKFSHNCNKWHGCDTYQVSSQHKKSLFNDKHRLLPRPTSSH